MPGEAIPAGKVIGPGIFVGIAVGKVVDRGTDVGCVTDEGFGAVVDPDDTPNIELTLTPSTE
ncbi:MAG TPA: hypothetical protein PKZ29_01280 [Candidatus Woesebacteria bacterium]|nr:hypothetical protein [Candidatus Woesebacteria bacterium]